MSQERRREIASRGGRAAHANGKAHEFTSKEAKKAGKKGGEVVARDKQHMVEIGRLGGLAKHRNSQNKSDANEET
jgi:general stress protein YciG